MSCPATRSKNASQHPGHILLEGKVKRRTSQQKQEDNAQAKEQRQEQTAALECGIKCLAVIMDQAEEEEGKLLTDPPKLRPRPRVVVRSASASKEVEGPGNKLSLDEDMSSLMDEGDLEEGLEVPVDEDKAIEGEGDQVSDDEATLRKPRNQKTRFRDATEAARGKLHQEVDGRGRIDGQK
ncbi:hypothetical protein BDN67DRAFT_984818 [Paxillus ammoniavirescens]|nr:hypothetical protein BDN67DRAFT_984818 [Paxillus ammoniavirescens]